MSVELCTILCVVLYEFETWLSYQGKLELRALENRLLRKTFALK